MYIIICRYMRKWVIYTPPTKTIPSWPILFTLPHTCVLRQIKGDFLLYTVDHNISAARKFRESAPMYIFATQNFRECAGTSTKKKRIMQTEAAVVIMRDLLWKRFR